MEMSFFTTRIFSFWLVMFIEAISENVAFDYVDNYSGDINTFSSEEVKVRKKSTSLRRDGGLSRLLKFFYNGEQKSSERIGRPILRTLNEID